VRDAVPVRCQDSFDGDTDRQQSPVAEVLAHDAQSDGAEPSAMAGNREGASIEEIHDPGLRIIRRLVWSQNSSLFANGPSGRGERDGGHDQRIEARVTDALRRMSDERRFWSAM
jgi:hypothetical protein